MIIFKADNPLILRWLFPKLSIDPKLTGSQVVERLLGNFLNRPEETACYTAFDGKELQGFILGWLIPDIGWAWVEQAWADPKLDNKYKKELLDKFTDWAKDKGIHELRMETMRNQSKAWERLYGFKEQSVIMRKEL